jgi:hypothetical protein
MRIAVSFSFTSCANNRAGIKPEKKMGKNFFIKLSLKG